MQAAVAPPCITETLCPATVNVPVREVVFVFAATENVIVPAPAPLAPVVTASHASFAAAVHVQPVPPVTVTEPVPPDAGIENAAVLRGKEHAAAACVIVATCPFTVMRPIRLVVVVFAAAFNPMVAFPVPVAPEVMVNHAASLVAVQLHVAVVATSKLRAPPAAGEFSAVDESVYAHAAAAWETVNV